MTNSDDLSPRYRLMTDDEALDFIRDSVADGSMTLFTAADFDRFEKYADIESQMSREAIIDEVIDEVFDESDESLIYSPEPYFESQEFWGENPNSDSYIAYLNR